MLILPTAFATVAIGLAAAVGLGLSVVLFIRQSKQTEALRRELDDLRRMQNDGALDARNRIEEASRVMREVQDEVEALATSRELVAATASEVEGLKGSFAAAQTTLEGLDARLSGVAGEVTSLAGRVEEVEQQGSAAEAGVESFREEWSRIQSMVDQSERQIARFAEDRRAEEERLADLKSAVGTLRGTVEDRIAVQEERLEKLETGPQAQLKAAAEGLDTRAAVEPDEAKPDVKPAPKRAPVLDDDDDERGARWIFLVMAALLALALIAQYVRS